MNNPELVFKGGNNMNFLEAHKIFHEYSELLAKGNYSKQALPCNGDFEQMNNAAIIVISHDYYFHEGTQEYFDSLFSVACFLGSDMFKDEDILQQEKVLERYIEKNSKFPWSKINKNRLDNAQKELFQLNAKSFDSSFSLSQKLLERREKITIMFFKKCSEEQWDRNSLDDSIKAAQYLYDILGMEYTDLDICSFFTLHTMRWLKKYFDEGGFLYHDVELNKQLVQLIKQNWDYISRYKW